MRTFTAAAALMLSCGCGAAEVIDGFDHGVNPDNWEWSNDNRTIVADGGTPGAWLNSEEFFSIGAGLRAIPRHGTPLAEALASARLTSFSFDFQHLPLSCDQPGRLVQFYLILTNTHGTAIHEDDDYAYAAGAAVPQELGTWSTQSFAIPSTSPTLPEGWTGGHQGDPEHFRPGVTWPDFIAQVDEIDVDISNPFEPATNGCYNLGVDSILVEYDDTILSDGFDDMP
jgi:hypothetical protein